MSGQSQCVLSTVVSKIYAPAQPEISKSLNGCISNPLGLPFTDGTCVYCIDCDYSEYGVAYISVCTAIHVCPFGYTLRSGCTQFKSIKRQLFYSAAHLLNQYPFFFLF
jgi:hypothetical protein